MESITEQSFFRTIGLFFWELVKAFLIAMVIIVPIRYFIMQPFFVRGESMNPTFDSGEYLIIDQLSYRLREPRRGEVIVFRYPQQPSKYYIKRIIGLPGDVVVVQDGSVVLKNEMYPDGVVLDESPYISDLVRTGGRVEDRLGPDEYFVLGDNRAASSDSRSWGSLARGNIIGRAWIRAWPFDRVGVFVFDSPGFLGL